jgi:tetratricopeptide (TPR) repeat protein
MGCSLEHVGAVCSQLGKLNEAEAAYREALDILRSLDDPFLRGPREPRGPSTLEFLAAVLTRAGKQAEVEDLFRQFLCPDTGGQPEGIALLQARSAFFALRGKWKESIADRTRLIEMVPDDAFCYYNLATLLVADGKLDDYRQLCVRMLARFGHTQNGRQAIQTVKACLILPSSGVDLDRVGELAETAVKADRDSVEAPFAEFSKAWAEFRQGHPASAVGWSEKALAAGLTQELEVQACMVLAMARYESGDAEGARAALSRGTQIADTKLRGSVDYWNGIIANALMREAKELIEGGTPAVVIQGSESKVQTEAEPPAGSQSAIGKKQP